MEITLSKALSAFLGLVIFFFCVFNIPQVAFTLNYQDYDDKQINDLKSINENITLDESLGPELNFPFRPENHRDNSNSIGRIASTRSENLP